MLKESGEVKQFTPSVTIITQVILTAEDLTTHHQKSMLCEELRLYIKTIVVSNF